MIGEKWRTNFELESGHCTECGGTHFKCEATQRLMTSDFISKMRTEVYDIEIVCLDCGDVAVQDDLTVTKAFDMASDIPAVVQEVIDRTIQSFKDDAYDKTGNLSVGAPSVPCRQCGQTDFVSMESTIADTDVGGGRELFRMACHYATCNNKTIWQLTPETAYARWLDYNLPGQ